MAADCRRPAGVIVFDLRCRQAHVFEAWFASSAAYADQVERGLVACPICGDSDIGKAVMAPAISPKSNSRPAPDQVKAALKTLAAAQARALESSTWVGPRFAERARAMHDGAVPLTTIHGQATLAEAKALVDDGVPVAPLPLPVVPPERQN